MKTIIIQADFSDSFYNSINLALLFDLVTPIDVLLVFERFGDDHQIQVKFGEIVTNYLPTFSHPDSNIRYMVNSGKFGEDLKPIIEANKDSVFIATYHDTPDKSNKLYSVEAVYKLIRDSKHNVLTLPNTQIPHAFDNIVFPVHNLAKVRHKVTFTSHIAKIFQSRIHVINCLTTNQPNIVKQCTLYAQQITNHLRNIGIPTMSQTLTGKKIHEIILDYSNEVNANLISLIPETGSSGLFSKGHLHEMLCNTTIPLLIVAPRKSKITGSFSTSAG